MGVGLLLKMKAYVHMQTDITYTVHRMLGLKVLAISCQVSDFSISAL